MKRDWDMNEVSDGRKYGLSDLVKADCGDCKGCSACCHDMGTSIVLDPLDCCLLTQRLDMRFEQLLAFCIELNMVDGVILPNLKMKESGDHACVFLDENGRCSIHSHRPGICRIFPLGRIYEEESFSYFLQVHECPKENKAKVKVSKWIDTKNPKKNQEFITKWHYFIKEAGEKVKTMKTEEDMKKISMMILQSFYMEPFTEDEEHADFYSQFDNRLKQSKMILDRM